MQGRRVATECRGGHENTYHLSWDSCKYREEGVEGTKGGVPVLYIVYRSKCDIYCLSAAQEGEHKS